MIAWCRECWNPIEDGRYCICELRKMGSFWEPIEPSPGVHPCWAQLYNDTMHGIFNAAGTYGFTEYFGPREFNTVDLKKLRAERLIRKYAGFRRGQDA